MLKSKLFIKKQKIKNLQYLFKSSKIIFCCNYQQSSAKYNSNLRSALKQLNKNQNLNLKMYTIKNSLEQKLTCSSNKNIGGSKILIYSLDTIKITKELLNFLEEFQLYVLSIQFGKNIYNGNNLMKLKELQDFKSIINNVLLVQLMPKNFNLNIGYNLFKKSFNIINKNNNINRKLLKILNFQKDSL
jgi:hypothetical protein